MLCEFVERKSKLKIEHQTKKAFRGKLFFEHLNLLSLCLKELSWRKKLLFAYLLLASIWYTGLGLNQREKFEMEGI